MMKKTYIRPKIWMEELRMESQVLAESLQDQLTNVKGNSGLGYGGGGSGPARAGENHLWDDDDDDSGWDDL